MIVEQKRTGIGAWVRRHCRWLDDPEPVTSTRTEQVDCVTMNELNLLGQFVYWHNWGVL